MEKTSFYNQLEGVIKTVINDEYPEMPITVTENTKLLEEYPVDSIFGIQILSLIEEEFNIVIDDEDLSLNLFEDLEKLRAYIEARMGNS